jgi:rsbT co-antagonist protein RsbR
MVVVNGDGEIVFVNAQVEKLFGYHREELPGKEIELLVPQHLQEKHSAHRAAFSAQPRLREMGAGLELHALRKDGRSFRLRLASARSKPRLES